jgi:hypothetical protein
MKNSRFIVYCIHDTLDSEICGFAVRIQSLKPVPG